MVDGDFAGLGALQRRYGLVGIKMTAETKSIVMIKTEADVPVELASIPFAQDVVYLKVSCDFQDRRDVATFSYSLDGKQWTAIGEPLQMAYTLPHFMGYRFAIFNYATKQPGGFVDVDYFRVEE